MKNLRRFLVFAACSALSCSLGCGGGSSSNSSSSGSSGSPSNQTIASSGPNVAAITVNSGPPGNGGFANGAFATVTVCTPGTTTCQTIDGLLVDTGSVGLRIVSSVLMIALPQQKSTGGSPVVECLQFLDSFSWGPVQTADIEVASEKASSVPVHVLSDTDFTVPATCSSAGPSADTVATLGANGILGVGLFPQDCGPACVQSSTNTTPPENAYYECPSSTGCQAMFESLPQQVQNPVALFATDNNGIIVELPPVSGAEPSVNGSLVFGIGTQSNNGLAGATVYTAGSLTSSSPGNFATTFNSASMTSFIDSGSNGYFFPDSSITVCSDNSGFYCPSSTQNLSATNQGVSAGSGTVDFSVANADSLFSNANDSAFGDLAGPAPTGGDFDWGLPFFYGRNVFVAIEGTNAPGGTAPYWAY
jgi:uncharacterized protein DUF3443